LSGKVTKKLGPKFKPIDISIVEKLASIHCTDKEICLIVGISDQTLANREKSDPKLREAIERGRANFKVSIRRAQAMLALKGNATMLIWLGKQYLDQKDQPEIKMDDIRPVLFLPVGYEKKPVSIDN
jgi:hypothetical protein